MDPHELTALSAAVRSGRTRLFHGGAPDLPVSGYILPARVTGAASMRGEIEQAGFKRITASPDLVYVTTERSLAAAIAASWGNRGSSKGRGWVYRVELDDEDLVPDEDLPRGPFINFQLRRARIAAVLDRGVDPDDRRHARTLAKFVASIG